jgi:hypothetical protein
MPKSNPYMDLYNLAKFYSVVEIDCTMTPYPATGTMSTDVGSIQNPVQVNPLPSPDPVCISMAQLQLSNLMRMLWEQHIVWTAFTIKAIAEDSPYTDLVVKRLLRNPKDFEAALRPIYGSEKAAMFADLLTKHLEIAAEVVKAAKAGNTAAANDAEKRWYANADEIAAFLASINPYWSMEEWRQMLYEHLRLTKTEAVLWLTKDYARAISILDDIEKQALGMADMMTEGIIRQFPNTFRG